jgi:hypothetical protein
MKPTLHKPVPMGTRVRLPKHYDLLSCNTGEVAGVASQHVIFQYIVILDVPFESDSLGICKAVTCTGGELESEDGQTNWRL